MSLAATAVLQAHPFGPGGARPAVATVDTRTPDGHTIRCHSRRRGAAVNRRIAAAAFATLAVPAWAGKNGASFFSTVPTLDEVGLAALIALVAGVAGWAAGRRPRK